MSRRILSALLILVTAAAGLAAEEEPQIAYRILSGYLVKEEADAKIGNKIAGTILCSTGGLLIAGAGATWFAGDWIGDRYFGGPMDPDIKVNVSLGLGIGGLATTVVGAGLLSAKPRDRDEEYAEVFAENDAKVREALAVAALKDLAIQGKKRRMTSAVSNLAVPIVYGLVRAGMNAVQGDPWNKDLFDGFYWNAWNVASGLSDIFGTTEEERLYDKYLAGRDALYGDRPAR